MRLLTCMLILGSASGFAPGKSVDKQQKTALHAAPTEDDVEIQWDLFQKHHAKGSWKGIWTSYDYIGDVVDETVASVDLVSHNENSVQHSHTIVVGAKRADCETCFDSMETKSFPVATYAPGKMHKARLGSVGMVNGPSLLRSGAMATELVLRHGDGRLRVTFQHAPVWEAGTEPGSCPPQGLKLFRTIISREALRNEPPTADTEAIHPPIQGNPNFYRPVPPFDWHKKWAGTSWTWGPQAGNQGWMVEQLEEVDAWHGRPTGDSPNVWNLRLPGGILLQGPRIVQDGEIGICRLAWMPDTETLLRLEAGIVALEPMVMEDDTLVGFHPPSLGSYRCDTLKKVGELEDVARFVGKDEGDVMKPRSEEEIKAAFQAPTSSTASDDGDDSGLDDVRQALQL